MNFPQKLMVLSVSAALLAGCNSNDKSGFSFSLPEGKVLQLDIDEPLETVAYEIPGQGIAQLPLSIGFGSGAFHHADDPANIFYTITDRGPNIPCGSSLSILKIEDLCGAGNNSGKIFPVTDFAPTIVKWELTGTPGNYSASILNKIPLSRTDGSMVTGLTNNLVATDTEGGFSLKGEALAYDNGGLDPEALVKLKNGSFWIAEEYGPSLVHVSKTGQVLSRVVPASVTADIVDDAGYPVVGRLPEVLKHRKLNRGIESLAISPNEDALYFAMQSPLANPNADAYKNSRHLRVLKYALNGDGSLGDQLGEWSYEMDWPQTFASPDGTGDVSTKLSDVKVSEMLAVGDDDLVVLERISKTTKLYRISLQGADNIMGQAVSYDTVSVNESDQRKTLEEVFDLAAVGARPVTKHLVFNSLTDMPEGSQLSDKVEGLALLDKTHLLMINDNDFGIAGAGSQITILPIGERLTEGDLPTPIKLSIVGRYDSGVYDESAAEIVDYHVGSQRLFVVNANNKKIDVLDLSGISTTAVAADPTLLNNLPLVSTLDISADASSLALGAANSVSVHGDLLAIAVEAEDKQANGFVAFYDLSGNTARFMKTVEVGALPDMVTFTPDGSMVVVANEAEPNDDYTNDPEGSISIIPISNGQPAMSAKTVSFVDFNAGQSRHGELSSQVRIFGPNASVAQDLEPEYIAISSDSSRAYVALQENNALAEIDLNNQRVIAIHPFGVKDYGLAVNAIDASDKDGAVNFSRYPGVVGMYQPDSIATMDYRGKPLVLSANEGDARDYSGFSEEQRAEDLVDDNKLDATNPQFAAAQDSELIGRLKVTTATGDTDKDGDIDIIHNYGARSFSIWQEGQQLFDSHSDIGRITAGRLGKDFNGGDKRSDDKGAEPEALTVGVINNRTYAFVGLERTSGIMIYDVTDPYGVQFIDYVENINRASEKGDIGPEGMKFIAKDVSPTGKPLLVVSNEVSGTTTVYQIDQ